MKFISLTIVCLFLITVSCKKEKTEEIKTEEELLTEEFSCDTCAERFMETFSEYTPQIRITITNQGFTLSNSISQLFKFKMSPAEIVDGAYFYKIERSVKCYYKVDPYEIDFEDSPGFYRYDYENQKAYHYATTTDTDPLLLMDFNHEIGDSIIVDETSSKFIYFIVEEKEMFLLDGYPMPMLKGHLSVNATNEHSNFVGKQIVLTPYYPNPVWIDRTFLDTPEEWDEHNFSDCVEGFTFFTYTYMLLAEDAEELSYGGYWTGF